MSLAQLNVQYLTYLSKYPLLTKALTAGILGSLNEIVASTIAGDKQTINIAGIKVRHILTSKTIGLFIFGFCMSAPISHNLYAIINQIFKPPISTKLKLLQILTSLATVTPTVSAVYTSWIGLLNAYHPNFSKNPLPTEIGNILRVIKMSLKRNYSTILKTSLSVSAVSLVIAQKYIDPQLWVVFFSVVSFCVGTYQNTKLKRKQLAVKKDE